MVKYILTILLFLGVVQAKEFTIKYLSCTLVEEIKNRTVDHITERTAKSRGMFELEVAIKETEFIMPPFTPLKYKETNGNGYDVYNFHNLSAYYKNGVRLLLEDTTQSLSYTRYFDCKKRSSTMKEKAEEIKNKWF